MIKAKHDPIVGKYVYVNYDHVDYRIYYEEAGQGIPLVCLHTAGTDAREYRHQLADPDIIKNFRVIAFDLPWHGKSLPPAGYYKMGDEYKLTTQSYTGIIMAFCDALGLDKPVIMGSSMGGNVCLPLALNYSSRIRALIALECAEYTPFSYTDNLWHPEIHGGELCATSIYDLMSPMSPEDYRRETWWYYSQSGPCVFKGDLYFYSLDHDFRNKCEEISGEVPIWLLTGTYDYVCTPERTLETSKKIKNSHCVIMEGMGHFPMCEDPVGFKKYLIPVLEKIQEL